MTTATFRPLDPHAVLTLGAVTMRPITDADVAALQPVIGVAEVFAGGYGGGPSGFEVAQRDWSAWLRGYLPAFTGKGLSFAVELGGELVGTSSIEIVNETHGQAHIGWTAYSPKVWGSLVNPTCKRLLLGFIFDAGWERVRIQGDVLNARSRSAIEKLGATFEGIQRHTQLRPDGSWRDTMVFSIIRDDWPSVRAGLDDRIRQLAE